MAINFAEIQQKLDRVLSNAGEIVRNLWKLHFDPNPQDVLTEIYDENGNLRQVSIPNLAKWRDTVWRDAQSAMSKTFYVDAVNGSDTTGDGSATNPFKTIKKAIDSVPVGGYATINLKSGQVHKITSLIFVLNKTLFFQTWNADWQNLANNAWIENTSFISPDDNANRTNGFILRNGAIYFNWVNIRTANYADNTKPLSIWEGLFRRWDLVSVRVNFFKSIIELGDTNLVRTATGSHNMVDLYFWFCIIKQVGPNRAGLIILNEAGNVSIADVGSSITLQNGTTGTMSNLIGGQIVRGATTNIPLNFVTNFVL